MSGEVEITQERVKAAEAQIAQLRREIDYITYDYTAAWIAERLKTGELYIPQGRRRPQTWTPEDMSCFVESILLGLPIPVMFFARVSDGRCDIIDGAQRVQTLKEFLSGDLILGRLNILKTLEG